MKNHIEELFNIHYILCSISHLQQSTRVRFPAGAILEGAVMILFVVLGNITCPEILDDKYTHELLLFCFFFFFFLLTFLINRSHIFLV